MSIPTSQKVLRLEKPHDQQKGQRNLAAVREALVPDAKDGQVLVQIHAAGFNRRDEWAMLGAYPGLTYKDSTLGCDGAGVIVRGDAASKPTHPQGLVLLVPTRGWASDKAGPEGELPNSTESKQVNDLGGKGFGLLGATKPTSGAGTFAEYIQVGKDQVADAPRHLDAVQAACLPCGGVTAYRALFTKGQLQSGQNLLVTGIGGGVALLALQLAVAAGANVYVTGGSDAKIARAKELGAKGGAIYKDATWPEQIRKLLAEHSKDRPYLDVVLDSAGGEIPAQAAKSGIRNGGKIVCFGMTAVPKMTFTMREVLKNVDILGSTMGSAAEFRDMLKFVEKHKIVPIVDTVLQGLDEAKKGFPLLADADKRSGGKVVVSLVSNQSKL
ncbi:NAD(P)-binding protein [Ceraceosorus guamensis]|uniref:NAD(P)-binding protein n=1 Tax=Ceraceosorus guamensis TaxID=1522189 RepID=A0A316W6Q7_9BASI|nr:NAD(P)-binding protein [Ceraceosorus guamensis]PWN45472.1 NAD(P)-binding protein [Ceraceosorus guamensis]